MELKLEVRFKAEHNLFIFLLYIVQHSSEIKGLCLMKCSSETFQNLPYFWNKKTQTVFFFIFHFEQLWICNSRCPDLCWHRPGHPLLQIQSSSKWKMKTTIWVFLFQIYGKFWSVSLDNFIKHKPPISEKWLATSKLKMF